MEDQKDGLGHIKRCITLSKTIGQNPKFKKPIFVLNRKNTISQKIIKKNKCRYLLVDGQINSKNELNEFIKILLTHKPKILVIDSKRINKKYISIVNKYSKIVIFEDEKKKFNVKYDLLINNNIWAKSLYTNKTKKLLGLKFNTVSQNFLKKSAFNLNSKTILISLGGEDPNNLSLKVLSLIKKVLPFLNIVIILGHSHPNKNSVYEFSKKNLSNFKIFNSPEDISIYLKNLKFVITAGGTSVYEFASARIPQLVVILEKHQKRMAKAVEQNSFGKILIRNDKKIEKNLLKTLKIFMMKNVIFWNLAEIQKK